MGSGEGTPLTILKAVQKFVWDSGPSDNWNPGPLLSPGHTATVLGQTAPPKLCIWAFKGSAVPSSTGKELGLHQQHLHLIRIKPIQPITAARHWFRVSTLPLASDGNERVLLDHFLIWWLIQYGLDTFVLIGSNQPFFLWPCNISWERGRAGGNLRQRASKQDASFLVA